LMVTKGLGMGKILTKNCSCCVKLQQKLVRSDEYTFVCVCVYIYII
jgi:hypothetical protein